MKFRFLCLAIAILLSAAVVAGYGYYLKYDMLSPLLTLPGMEYYAEKTVLELPFLMYSDEVLKFMVEEILYAPPEETEPSQMEPAPTDTPTQPSTIPATSVPEISGTSIPTVPSQSSATVPTESSSATTGTITVPPTTIPTMTTVPPTTIPTRPSTTNPVVTTTPTEAPTEPTQPDVPSGYPDFYFPQGVDDSWFDDVLFIGDSRTDSLKSYARSGKAEYFCDVGATVFDIRTRTLSDQNFSNQTLESLLSSRKYGKIFIHLGLNEIGYPLSSVYSAYKKLVDFIREKQPNAVIIMQAVMSVTRSKASQASYFEPSNIAKLNNKIQSYANGKDIFYIDCNAYFADAEGYLYTSLTYDGYHPHVSGCRIWRNWLQWVAAQLSI